MNLVTSIPIRKHNLSSDLARVDLTVGIPCFNEESNITKLLAVISEQQSEVLGICEIIISDDSSDSTVRLIEEFALRNPYLNIRCLHHSSRRGVASAWNEIFQNASGHLIVLFDGDVMPDKDSIRELLSSLNGHTGLCISNTLPAESSTIAGRASRFVSTWLRLVKLNRLSQYTTIGRGLLIRTDIAKEIIIPEGIIAVDLYLQCKVLELRKEIVYNDRSVVCFNPPKTIKDFNSQVIRSTIGHRQIDKWVDKFHIRLPLGVAFRSAWKAFMSDPIGAFSVATCYALLPYHKTKLQGAGSNRWYVAQSTK